MELLHVFNSVCVILSIQSFSKCFTFRHSLFPFCLFASAVKMIHFVFGAIFHIFKLFPNSTNPDRIFTENAVQ